MKINVLATAFVIGLSFSTIASAVEFTSGQSIDTTACPLLANSVTLNLSNRVNGGYECDEATSTITVAACHEGGSRRAEITCAVETPAEGTTPATYNHTSCNDTNVGQTITLAAPSYSGFLASSRGGSVVQKNLAANCTAAALDPLVAID